VNDRGSLSSVIDDNLLAAYETSEFVVPSLGLVLVPRKLTLAQQLTWDQLGATSLAFITAANPYSVPLRDDANANLLGWLKRRLHEHELQGYAYKGYGRAPRGRWPAEHGYLVASIDYDLARDLSRQLHQNAMLWVSGRDAAPTIDLLRESR